MNCVSYYIFPSLMVDNFPQHCDILRRAAEAGGLLVDAMINVQDSTTDSSSSIPLMVVENGCGSPCIDLRQVSSELAAAAKDADLVRCLPTSLLFFFLFCFWFFQRIVNF